MVGERKVVGEVKFPLVGKQEKIHIHDKSR